MLQARFLSGYTKDTAEERIKIIATRQKEEIIPLGFKEGLSMSMMQAQQV